MAKWVIKAIPLSESPTAPPPMEGSFSTDNAAKAYVRDLIQKPYSISVQSAPGRKPIEKMGHAEALRWAHG
jgi:hypothetical protein